MLLLVLFILPLVFGQQSPLDAWHEHAKSEAAHLWTISDLNHNDVYDMYDISEFIRAYDLNNDNEVTFSEFDTFLKPNEPSLYIVETGLFKQYDDNQDNVITQSDFTALLRRIDTNGDGSVDRDEYITFMVQLLTFLYVEQFGGLE